MILKPLGLCVYCQNFWITLVAYSVLFGLDWTFFLAIGGTHITIKLLDKWLN